MGIESILLDEDDVVLPLQEEVRRQSERNYEETLQAFKRFQEKMFGARESDDTSVNPFDPEVQYKETS
jgi:hypothetical protein